MIDLDANMMTRAELADRLHVTRQYLDALACQRKGPPYVRIGRSIRYDRAQVAAWLEARTNLVAA